MEDWRITPGGLVVGNVYHVVTGDGRDFHSLLVSYGMDVGKDVIYFWKNGERTYGHPDGEAWKVETEE